MSDFVIPMMAFSQGKTKRHLCCPKCGSYASHVTHNGSVDTNGMRGLGRMRVCKDCDASFGTIEVTAQFAEILMYQLILLNKLGGKL